MRRALAAAAVVLLALHQDAWLWGDRRLLLGFLPPSFLYHLLYCLASSLLLLLLVRFAWPRDLEEGGFPGGEGPGRAPRTP